MDNVNDLYDNLLVELECPVCTNYMAPPIRQCATGHSICEPCRRKLPKCPLCQGAFTESKNLSLEALACKIHYPCVNRPSGCTLKLTLQQRESHEMNCSFRGFKCAIDRCGWVGKADDIVDHWASKKMKSKTFHSFNLCHTKVRSDLYYANLVEAHDHLFWFKCNLERGKIFWAVQLIGKKEEASNYIYEIEIFKPGTTRPKILFSDYCQSVDMQNNELFKDGACITMSTECISRFMGEDQLLIYYLRVHRAENDQTSHENKEVQEGEKSRRNFKKHSKKHRDRSKGAASHAPKSEKASYSTLHNEHGK